MRERSELFRFLFLCVSKCFSFAHFFFLWEEENAGSEEGDELEKGGEGPSGSGSSCLTFLLHYFPCSQA